MNYFYHRLYFSAFALLLSFAGAAQSTNPSPYCDGKFDDVDGTFPVNDQIKSVTIGTLTNASNAQYAAPHYVFYNNLASPSLTIGSPYQLSLKFYVAGGAGYGVWIDYNRNSVFDANEKVAGSTAAGWLTLGDNIAANPTITIPATAQAGTTRMRVRIVEDDMYTAVNGANIAACNAGTTAESIMDWGETEDYTVTLVGPAANVPVVNSTAASTITTTTATLGGSVNANGGGSCTVSFEYGTTTSYGQTKAATPATVTGSTLTTVTGAITALTPGTLYHYRTKVVVGNQSYFGADKTFTTLNVSPTVSSTTASSVTDTEANLGGTVNANGGAACTVTFEFGLTIAYGQSKAATPGTVTGNVNTPVSALVISLLPNKTYHYRTKVVAGGQTYYGGDKTFVTLIPDPIVNSTTATSITTTSATLGGSVNANGGLSCAVSFEFGTTLSYGSTAAASPNTVIGSTLLNVTGSANGLTPATLYHYRTKVVTNGQTFYGVDKTFTTQVATSVDPNETTEVLSFFPNPVQDVLQVKIPERTGECTLSVYSLTGKVVYQEVCQPGLQSVPVAELPAGLYQIRLINSQKVVGKGSFIR